MLVNDVSDDLSQVHWNKNHNDDDYECWRHASPAICAMQEHIPDVKSSQHLLLIINWGHLDCKHQFLNFSQLLDLKIVIH